MKKLLFIIFIFLSMSSAFSYENSACTGTGALLSILNRPTFQDSSCVVGKNHMVLELGTEYFTLSPDGRGYDIPEAVLRYGFSTNSEVFFILPDYFNVGASGFDAPTAGIKHLFVEYANLIISGEALLTLPTGSYHFGNTGYGATINTIIAYSITSEITLSTALGVSTQTAPLSIGGQRFNSFNPDLVLTWRPLQRFQVFGELYGQSQIAPAQGSGYVIDGGVQYLVNNRFEIDFSAGLPIKNQLGGFVHYYAIGLGVMF